MPLPHGLAKFNRIGTNRVLGLLTRGAPGFAMVIHQGRKSGREFRTPVNVFAREDGYRIALTYGPDADWVKNVLAAGRFEIVTGRTRVVLVDPTVSQDNTASWAPLVVRAVLRTVNARNYLQARRE